jgi:hypothetical protein
MYDTHAEVQNMFFRYGKVDVTDKPPTPDPVMFHAERRSNNIKLPGLIAYTDVLINHGGGMSTDGKFTAPEPGYYMFVLSGTAQYQYVQVNIKLQRNDGTTEEYEVYENDGGSSIARTLDKTFMLTLNKGDIVFLENDAVHSTKDSFNVNSLKPFTFSGYRMTT